MNETTSLSSPCVTFPAPQFLFADQDPDDNMVSIHWQLGDETVHLIVCASGKLMRIRHGHPPIETSIMDMRAP